MRQRNVLTIGMGLLVSVLMAGSASAYYSPSMGRFLNRDPINEPGAVLIRQMARPAMSFIPRDPIASNPDANAYGFVNNSPTNLIDPDGLKARASINKKDCTITLTLNFGIYGAHASWAVGTAIEDSIESWWNGHNTKRGCKDSDSGGCGVKVKANVKYYQNAKHWYDVPQDNQLKVVDTVGPGGNIPRGLGGVFQTYTYGHTVAIVDASGTPQESWLYAHEAGHSLGLPDDYCWLTPDQPNKGHEGHMMAEWYGTVAQHEIDGALFWAGAKCPKECCCPKK